jgi:hypothetical protein
MMSTERESRTYFQIDDVYASGAWICRTGDVATADVPAYDLKDSCEAKLLIPYELVAWACSVEKDIAGKSMRGSGGNAGRGADRMSVANFALYGEALRESLIVQERGFNTVMVCAQADGCISRRKVGSELQRKVVASGNERSKLQSKLHISESTGTGKCL